MITAEAFKDAMAAVCAPVTVITTTWNGRPFGTTVSAFWSLSLQPPLVGLALANDSELLARLRSTRRLGVNLLADGQQEVALRFAGKGGDAKFAGVPWVLDDGLPRLARRQSGSPAMSNGSWWRATTSWPWPRSRWPPRAGPATRSTGTARSAPTPRRKS